LGPDARWTAPVDVLAAPLGHDGTAAEDVRVPARLFSSAPLRSSPLQPRDVGSAARFSTELVVAGLVLLALWALTRVPLLGFVAASALLFGLAGLWSWRRHRRHGLADVRVRLREQGVRRGRPFTVDIENPSRRPLEIGRYAVEIRLESNGRRPVGYTHPVVVEWLAVEQGTIRLPTSPDDPVSYAGEYVALHWFVLVRDASLEPSLRDLTTLQFPVAVVA
jgi:hypothetical protein